MWSYVVIRVGLVVVLSNGIYRFELCFATVGGINKLSLRDNANFRMEPYCGKFVNFSLMFDFVSKSFFPI